MKRVLLFLTAALTLTPLSLFAPNRQDKCFWIEQYLKVFPELEYAEVLANVDVESSSRERVKRFEKSINCYARGPLQITDKTARLAGYRGALPALQSWKDGLYWGMKHMASQKRRYKGDSLKMFAAYNLGSVKYRSWGIANKTHVGRCMKRLKYWQGVLSKAKIPEYMGA